jgi:uncharacterized protein YecE (DUF72 family)
VNHLTEIYLGCSGWSYDDWIGTFYDKNISSNLMLLFYAKVFRTVEINSTFYALPRSIKVVENWYKKTPNDFIFSVKFPQKITHETLGKKDLESEIVYISTFFKLIAPLKDKLGPILIQFPPKFEKNLDLLENLTKYLIDKHSYTMEFRNKTWIKDNKLDPETKKLLEKQKIAYCIVSEPGPIPPITEITTTFAYIRWHGFNTTHWYNYLYTDQEIKEEKERLENIQKNKTNNKKVKRIYGYFNNHLNGQAPANCIHLLKLMGKETLDPKSINIHTLNLPKGQKRIDKFFK